MGALKNPRRATRLVQRIGHGFGKRRTLRDLAEDRSGNVVVLAAIMLPVLIGGMGLGAEAGYWYFQQRKLQHAADVAAYAAGVRLKRGDRDDILDDVAVRIARQSGYSGASDDVANNPPTSGTYAGDDDTVEVILAETVPRALSSLFLQDDLSLSGRAVVAVIKDNPACVLALSPHEPAAVELTGNANVSLSGCHVVANSSDPDAFSMSGNADLTVDCVHTVGGAYVQKQHKLDMEECEEVNEGISPVADPYADLDPPVCGGAKVYCHSGLSFKNTVELDEGIYIIDGGTLEFTANADVTGENVTFFLKNSAKVDIKGNAEIDLKAPTDPSHPYAGVLFFGDRGDTDTGFSMKGNGDGVFQGAIYFPSGHVEFTGNGDLESECIQLIANTVKLTGNADFKTNCEGAGVRQANVAGGVRIVE